MCALPVPHNQTQNQKQKQNQRWNNPNVFVFQESFALFKGATREREGDKEWESVYVWKGLICWSPGIERILYARWKQSSVIIIIIIMRRRQLAGRNLQ